MKPIIAPLLAILFFVAPAYATTVVDPLTADAQWQQMFSPTHNGTDAYWDNPSWDGDPVGGGADVGYFLAGNYGATNLPGPAQGLNQNPQDWEYLTTVSKPYQNGTLAGPAAFTLAGGNTYTFTAFGGVAGYPANKMGWFYLNDPSTLHQLFTGNSSNTVFPQTATVVANSEIGLYFTNGGPGLTEYSTNLLPAGNNLNDAGIIGTGMALFQQTGGPANSWGTLLLGVEDIFATTDSNGNVTGGGFGDSDYNDMLIGIGYTTTTIPLPEPTSVTLLLGGFSLLTFVVFRRNATRKTA